jgi:hypothetical protein
MTIPTATAAAEPTAQTPVTSVATEHEETSTTGIPETPASSPTTQRSAATVVASSPTTTTSPMDPATVAWWFRSRPLHDVACDVGFLAASRVPGQEFIDQGTYERLCDGETPVPQTGPAYTKAELNEILGPPIAAWLEAPSPATYDALAAVALSMLMSGRSLGGSGLTDGGGESGTATVARLARYPGDDNQVALLIDHLALDIPTPFVLDLGTYMVNSEVPPGTYRALDVRDCYWKTVDDRGEINDNNYASTAPQILMTIHPSDFAVVNECDVMVKID